MRRKRWTYRKCCTFGIPCPQAHGSRLQLREIATGEPRCRGLPRTSSKTQIGTVRRHSGTWVRSLPGCASPATLPTISGSVGRADGRRRAKPSRTVLKSLTEALFPRHYGRSDFGTESIDAFVEGKLGAALDGLLEQVYRGQTFVSDGAPTERHFEDAVALTRDFAARLPEIRGRLVSDLRAAFVGDPAATSFPEILIGYPAWWRSSITASRTCFTISGQRWWRG